SGGLVLRERVRRGRRHGPRARCAPLRADPRAARRGRSRHHHARDTARAGLRAPELARAGGVTTAQTDEGQMAGRTAGDGLKIVRLTPSRMDDMGKALSGTWGSACWCMFPRL